MPHARFWTAFIGLPIIVVGLAVASIAPAAALGSVGDANDDDSVTASAFTDLLYDKARAAAEESGAFFLAYATATWCAPCRMMEQTTWVDEQLLKLMDERVVAYKLDVDEEEELATALHISAMPTMVIFKDGEEFDRRAGYTSAEEMIEWINDVRAGRRWIDRQREEIDELRKTDRADMRARMDFARTLIMHSEFEEATDEMVWLWHNMLKHEPAMYGVRLSFFVGDIQMLISRHEPARVAFAAIRDELEANITEAQANSETIRDWIALNEALGQTDRALKLYDRVKDDPEHADVIRLIAEDVMWMLIQQDRWREAGELIQNPVGEAQQAVHLLRMMTNMGPGMNLPDEQVREMRKFAEARAREELSRRYAALLAAARDDDAGETARILLEALDSSDSYAALVRAALAAGVARPSHQEWLERARGGGADVDALAKELNEALERGAD